MNPTAFKVTVYSLLINIHEVSFFCFVQKNVESIKLLTVLNDSTPKTLPVDISFKSCKQTFNKILLSSGIHWSANFLRQFSCQVLKTASQNFVCRFHEVKGRSRQRVLGVGQLQREAISKFFSCGGCFHGYRRLSLALPGS